ncbi:hypothetical protein Pla52n_08960 [Stieleria varia]|uniref:Methylamine utilization protein n=2 Tax=Stieleria varia TaxID=2528005 RepID=A0A5C6BCZ1_9BACT|nr:hypothetical protein Pla52n_08960 [Stieleria varia]
MLSRIVLSAAAALLVLPSANADETATLKMTFKYKGDAPAPKFLDPNKDKAFCGLHKIPDESLVVNQENNGIKNVIVYLKAGRRDRKNLPDTKPEPKTHILANENCRFEPHVIIAHAGDTIKVTNPDTVGHNANFAFFANNQQNLTVPSGGAVEVKVDEAEPAAIPVACNIHEWMLSHLIVLDHPFAAVSDENGVLEIKGIPAGVEFEFRASHDTGSFDDISVGGKAEKWENNRFKMELKPGMNDLGVVELDAADFQSK